MRTFHSYGPIDSEEHYYVERKKLVDQCTRQLVTFSSLSLRPFWMSSIGIKPMLENNVGANLMFAR